MNNSFEDWSASKLIFPSGFSMRVLTHKRGAVEFICVEDAFSNIGYGRLSHLWRADYDVCEGFGFIQIVNRQLLQSLEEPNLTHMWFLRIDSIDECANVFDGVFDPAEIERMSISAKKFSDRIGKWINSGNFEFIDYALESVTNKTDITVMGETDVSSGCNPDIFSMAVNEQAFGGRYWAISQTHYKMAESLKCSLPENLRAEVDLAAKKMNATFFKSRKVG